MTPLQLKVIYNAVVIRTQRGEDAVDVINSYEKLSKDEKKQIYDALQEQIEEEKNGA